MTRRNLTLLAILCAVAMSAACTDLHVTTPPGFVAIDNDWDGYDYRATTADGLVIGVRAIDHDPKGEQAFWIKAIQNRMRNSAGYALLETVPVKSADDVGGTQLRFGHDFEGNNPHLYTITLFVTEDKLFLLEAGGSKELMTASAAQLDAAVGAFRTDG